MFWSEITKVRKGNKENFSQSIRDAAGLVLKKISTESEGNGVILKSESGDIKEVFKTASYDAELEVGK